VTSTEVVYAVSGTFTCTAGLAMLLVYSYVTAWWKSHTGRMLATYAVAETGMSGIFAAAVVLHINPAWFSVVWVGLQATVGFVLWYQTFMIIILNRATKENPDELVSRSHPDGAPARE